MRVRAGFVTLSRMPFSGFAASYGTPGHPLPNRPLSLRFRLNLMITFALLAIFTVGGGLVLHHARRSVEAEVRSSVAMALQLVDAGLAHAQGDEKAAMAWLAEMGKMEKTRHLKIRIQQMPEKIIRLTKIEEEDPKDGRVPAWFAWAVTPDYLAGEKRTERVGAAPVSILVLADPADEIAEAWSETKDLLGLMGIIALSVYALVHFSLGRAFKPVGQILKALEGLEEGDYAQRLPDYDLPEFCRIARAFNHTAFTLDRQAQENRALRQQSLSIQEEERRHLAQELHDELGQSLTASKIMLESLRKGALDAKAKNTLESVIGLSEHLFGVVRDMMRRMRPMLLDEFGLQASLEDLVDGWRERGLAVRFCCLAGVEERAGEANIHLYRIVQECLTNIAKHAGANAVSVDLGLQGRPGHEFIRLHIQDDGRGFDPAMPRKGFGLLGMKERVAILGGSFALQTRPGQGVSITVTIPCKGGTA